MNRFFNPNNPVTVILSRIFDLILLNLCFLFACLPVVTIGSAMSALYAVTLKMADGDFGYTADIFFSSFRRNFKQATQLWIILLAAGSFLTLDLYVVFFVLPSNLLLLQIPIWLLLFADVSAMIYVFPMLARYEQATFNS